MFLKLGGCCNQGHNTTGVIRAAFIEPGTFSAGPPYVTTGSSFKGT